MLWPQLSFLPWLFEPSDEDFAVALLSPVEPEVPEFPPLPAVLVLVLSALPPLLPLPPLPVVTAESSSEEASDLLLPPFVVDDAEELPPVADWSPVDPLDGPWCSPQSQLL